MERKGKSGPVGPVKRVFHARVREVLGGVMAARGLRLLSGGPEGIATLTTVACWVKLQIHGDREVTCCLCDVAKGGIYDLRGYLRLMHCGCEIRTLADVGEALASNMLDGPLGGDFSWAADYWMLVEEMRDLRREAVPVLRRGA